MRRNDYLLKGALLCGSLGDWWAPVAESSPRSLAPPRKFLACFRAQVAAMRQRAGAPEVHLGLLLLLLGWAHAAGPKSALPIQSAWDEPLPASLDSRAQQLLSCYGLDPTDEPLQFGDYITGKRTSRLHVLSVLWSAKKGGNADSMLSVATVVTIDRMENLRAQCVAWPGPLTVALYQALTPEEWEQVKAAKAQQGKEGSAGRKLAHHSTKRAHSRLDRLFDAARELFKWAETHGDAACSLRMLLVVEPVQELILADLMPINALRNLAMLAADTPLEMMLDVDLVPSSNLAGRFLGGEPQAARRRQLSAAAVAAEEEAEEGGDAEWEDAADPGTPGEAEALGRHLLKKKSRKIAPRMRTAEDVLAACKNRSVVVLPAFERLEHEGVTLEEAIERSMEVTKATKQELVRQFQGGDVVSFHGKSFSLAQGASNYERWVSSNGSYFISWENKYEPYFIVDRLQLGKIPYDVRFRCGAHDKQTQVAQVALANYTFLAYPHAWVVHRPHPPSPYLNLLTVSRNNALSKLNAAPAPPALFDYSSSLISAADKFRKVSKDLYAVLLHDGKMPGYAPVVEEPFRQCLQKLGWWKGRAL